MSPKFDPSKSTCGPMYKESRLKYAGNDPALIHIFAAGFVTGQAEKVYLGACRAAMFRPSQDRYWMLLETVNDTAVRYGLKVVTPISSKKEIWICRSGYQYDIIALSSIEENSKEWHTKRAWLCGVPEEEIDTVFHLREGYGKRCD